LDAELHGMRVPYTAVLFFKEVIVVAVGAVDNSKTQFSLYFSTS
jgi:hypothetical protein